MRNRRRLFPLVAKYYQTRMLMCVMCYMILVIMFMAMFVFGPSFLQMRDAGAPLDVRAAAAENILYGHALMWPSLAVLVILMGIHFFQVFHRFIGPMYRFSHTFNRIAAGDVSFQIRLRRKDYLIHERDEINHMLCVLSEQIGSAKKDADLAMTIVQQMEKGGIDGSGRTPIPNGRLTELRELLVHLSEALGYFNTEAEQETKVQPEEAEEQVSVRDATLSVAST